MIGEGDCGAIGGMKIGRETVIIIAQKLRASLLNNQLQTGVELPWLIR
jgi:hypothetical protein